MEIVIADDELTRALVGLGLARPPLRSIGVTLSETDSRIALRVGLGPLAVTLTTHIHSLEVMPDRRLAVGLSGGLGRALVLAGVRRAGSDLLRWEDGLGCVVIDVPRAVPWITLEGVVVAGRTLRVTAAIAPPPPGGG